MPSSAVKSRSRAHIHKPHSAGERIADQVAQGVGSWRFVIGQAALMIVWIVLNTVAWFAHWDSYPFVFLNLAMSAEAAFATPVILMSQNRQAAKDHLRDDHEADEVEQLFAINQRQLEILRMLHALSATQQPPANPPVAPPVAPTQATQATQATPPTQATPTKRRARTRKSAAPTTTTTAD